MMEITLDMLANPFWAVIYARYYDEYHKALASEGERGDITLLLHYLAEHADVSGFKPGDNPYRYVLEKLKPYARYDLDWNKATGG
jgi:hypothetical protein